MARTDFELCEESLHTILTAEFIRFDILPTYLEKIHVLNELPF